MGQILGKLDLESASSRPDSAGSVKGLTTDCADVTEDIGRIWSVAFVR